MREPADIQLRGLLLLLMMAGGLLFLFGRLVQLQVLGQADWDDRSRRNQVRTQEIAPHRGLLLDRQGRVLADNRPSYTVYGVPATLLADSSVVHRLAELCGQDAAELFKRLARGGRRSLKAVKLLVDIPFDERVVLAENLRDFPGVKVQIEAKRHYPRLLAPHALGYLSEILEEELAATQRPDAASGDLVGRKGLEKRYEDLLRGHKGVEYITVDARGRELGPAALPPEAPVHGRDLVLGLDLDLQLLAEEALAGRRGAVVLVEIRSGRILAAASSPVFDLTWFSGRMLPENWARLNDEAERPLLNRYTQGVYPPGSIFKIAVAAWALEQGLVDESWSVTCTGAFQLGQRSARCWKRDGHGRMDMLQAVQQSCDVWFYQLGLKITPDEIREIGELFHLTDITGVDLDGERAGNMPDIAWFDRRFGERGWTRGVMLNLAIGQGEILVTPLQMALHACLLAGGGEAVVPHFADRAVDRASGEELRFVFPRLRTELSSKAWDFVRRSAEAVVERPLGTAHGQKRQRYRAAGKTGTSENPQGEPHAWFIGWMPLPDPEVAAVAVVENAGHGSQEAAPIAFRLFDAWQDLQEGRLVLAP
jgi:penicillin-binding protein 2